MLQSFRYLLNSNKIQDPRTLTTQSVPVSPQPYDTPVDPPRFRSVPVSPQLYDTPVDPPRFLRKLSHDSTSMPITQDHTSPLPMESQVQHPSFSTTQRPPTPEYLNTDAPTQETIHTNQELPIPNTINLVQQDDSWEQQEPTLPVSEENFETSIEQATLHLQRNLSHYYLLRLAQIIVSNFNAPLHTIAQSTFLDNWTHLGRTEPPEPDASCIITFLEHFNNIGRTTFLIKKQLYVPNAISLNIEASLFKEKLDQLKEEIQQQPEHTQALLQHVDDCLNEILLEHQSMDQSTLEEDIAHILQFLEQDRRTSLCSGYTAIEESYVTDAKTTYIEMEKSEESGTLPSAKNMIDALRISYFKHHSALAFLTQCQMQTKQYMNTFYQYLAQALDDTGQRSSAANPSERMLAIQSQRHAFEIKTNNVHHRLTSTLNALRRHYKTLEEKAERYYNRLSKNSVRRLFLHKSIGSPYNSASYKEFKDLIDLLYKNYQQHQNEIL